MATIEIDGKVLNAENGQMIIEVADEAGIYIPRFCYHKKLSVAANCRMCLVEVENGRKPVPACATPITNGMKVFTRSEEAVRSQEAVMEFLLINHPLDCPICDQGGECELQDISMGFGEDVSEYGESKRSVTDDDLGPLISTEMTRCIHCTRCVRFGEEVDGMRELGATGRGEAMKIGTFVKHSITSEVSGNIIDLCPVGALTSKPYRFTARAWELSQHDSISPHDCLGSNTHVHVRRNKLMRVVPKENETINEMWLSDRDRFSYLGLNHASRAQQPMVKRHGQWEVASWQEALQFTAEGISRVIKQYGAEQFAAFATPSATLEEHYLLQKWMRVLGVHNLDHRLHQTDFRDQAYQAVMPQSSLRYADVETQQTILLLGCNIHREVPLAGIRVRKAFRNGAAIYALNSIDYDYHFEVKDKFIVPPQDIPMQLAQLVTALGVEEAAIPDKARALLLGLEADERLQQLAEALMKPGAVIIMGALSENHPQASLIRTLVELISAFTETKVLRLTTGANSAGAWLAGMLPHRSAAGKVIDEPGLDVQAALDAKLKGYFLLNVDAGYDFANPSRTRQSMHAAEFVVAAHSFTDESVQEYADVILPIATYAETSGTYINVNGDWQNVKGALPPYGESRPAWKVLRVLANLLACPGFDYTASEDVLAELRTKVSVMPPFKTALYFPEDLPAHHQTELVRVGEWPLYRSDVIVRHSQALQDCAAAEEACVRVHPKTAARLKLNDTATVSQGDIEITLPLKRDERIALDVVWVPNALPETVDLGHAFAAITIKR